MFESIVIRQRSSASLGQSIDIGIIAEALLFYKDVRIIANPTVIGSLIKFCDVDVLIQLLESEFLKLSYEYDNFGIYTENSGTLRENHKPIYYSAANLELRELLIMLLEEKFKKSGKARRIANRIVRKTEIIRHEKSITKHALDLLSDNSYVSSSIEVLLKTYIPDYCGGFHFVVEKRDDSLFVETDIDFQQANRIYHTKISPTHSSLNPAYLLSHLMSVLADMHFAAQYNSEIAIDSINLVVARRQFEQLVQKLQQSKQQIAIFQEFIFDDSRAIAEAMRAGSYTLRDILKILPKAAEFKAWLQSPNAQSDIVKAYFKKVTEKTWIDKIPSKGARWVIFTGGGIAIDALIPTGIGIIGGVTLSVVDAFLLDKILTPWKPNQFVDEYLKNIVSVKSFSK